MKVCIAQLNPTVGDVAGNTDLVLGAIDAAARDGADVVLTAELVLVGYPPRDLLFREGVVADAEAAVERIAAHAAAVDPELTVVVGHPRVAASGVRPFFNSASVCRGGSVIAVYDKRLLPGYDVFDEDRYFEPGTGSCRFDVGGRRVGVVICEDLWRAGDVLATRRYGEEPVRELAEAGCDAVLCLNASPFVTGKWRRHREQMSQVAGAFRVPLVVVNQVGGNDDLVFDGRSVAIDGRGTIVAALPGWAERVETIDLAGTAPPPVIDDDPVAERFAALRLGVHDYCRKTGFDRALLGVSGGIDSALTAVIAAAALGPGNVTGVFMPSRYSSSVSREDAAALAANLGLRAFPEVPIQQMHLETQAGLARPLGARAGGLTDENIQARLRGLILMAFSNAGHGLVLATSNKSELAVGYSTLYGDMCGAVSVIGDLLKTEVWALARWINDHHEACGFARPPIPERSITRPPTAELRPDQTDQDSLPPYDVLDRIVSGFVDREWSATRIVEETGIDAALVHRVAGMIDRAQFKRDQGSVIPKVSPRAFGRGRPMPIVMKMDYESDAASKRRSDEGIAAPADRSPM